MDQFDRRRKEGYVAGAGIVSGEGQYVRQRDPARVEGSWGMTPHDPPIQGSELGSSAVKTEHLGDAVVTQAKTLARQADNLIEDPGFEMEHTRKNPQDGTFDNVVFDEGAWSLKVTGNPLKDNYYRPFEQFVPVKPGDRIALRCRYRHDGAVTAGMWLVMEWDDGTTSFDGPSPIADGVWRTLDEVRVVPAGKMGVRLAIVNEDNSASGSFNVDNVDMRMLRTWKTAESGARVEMDFDGVRLYNGANVLTVNLDAATGDALFTGGIEGGYIEMTDRAGNDTTLFIADDLGIAWARSDTDQIISWHETIYNVTASIRDVNHRIVASEGDALATPTRRFGIIEAINQEDLTGGGEHFGRIAMYAQRGGDAATNQMFMRMTHKRGSDPDAGGTVDMGVWDGSYEGKFGLYLDPTPSTQGNSRYAAGMKGSDWRVISTTSSSWTSATLADYMVTPSLPLIQGRVYLVLFHCRALYGPATEDVHVAITDGINNVLHQSVTDLHITGTSAAPRTPAFTLAYLHVAGATGGAVFKVRGARSAGAGTVGVSAAAANPAFMVVVDLGF